MSSLFSTERKILFQHCDPAGMVFYPRYFELINSVVEQWFEDAIGLSFADLHLERGVAIPTASISIDFRAPSQLGDSAIFSIDVTRFGTTSMHLALRAHCDGTLRLEGTQVLVMTDRDTRRPRPWLAEVENYVRAHAPELVS